jgi:hypothetical protein
MKKYILIVMLFVFSQLLFAEKLTTEKKRIIDEMLEITNAIKIGEIIATDLGNTIISSMSKEQNLDPKIIAIIEDEFEKIIHDEFIVSGFMNEISYKIYHKYFTLAELKKIVAFYKTPTGSKLATLAPKMTQEGMIESQKQAQSLGPIIYQRLINRLEKEGIK